MLVIIISLLISLILVIITPSISEHPGQKLHARIREGDPTRLSG